ncbi:hypothetical protein KI387_031445, partial [Taxus chinensis]
PLVFSYSSSCAAGPQFESHPGRKTRLIKMACPAPTTGVHRSSSLSLASKFCAKPPSTFSSRRTRRGPLVICAVSLNKTVVIGLAADSGCGKSTFMRRLTSVFGGAAEPPKGGNPDSNTLISDTTTVICLDDYHSLDRHGRKEKAVTALDPKANNFDLMYEHVKALKEGKPVMKPIYNHVSGLLDPPEEILPPKILVIEGLHPMFDSRVRDLLDFSIYLDISNEVKFAWKIQ